VRFHPEPEPAVDKRPPARGGAVVTSAHENDRADPQPDPGASQAAAEAALLRRLRGRQLSVSEAGAFLRERDLDAVGVSSVIDHCIELGYLDDARLAEQLVHTATSRKGQGRQAIALTLGKRGIAREVVDEALMALPDDDAERAAEFAASRVRSLRDLDRQTALRRLAGQLARRGFASHVALSAARAALDDAN
jgi:regulatory protein